MSVAQRLYEAGLITYMRTDSVNLSKLAMSAIADQVKSIYGAQFYKARTYHTASKGAQEAHEAIRPTYMEHRSIDADRDGQRLYDLIWKRTMACQMADAMLEKTSIDIDIVPGGPEIYEKQDRSVDGDEVFKAEGTRRISLQQGAHQRQLHEGVLGRRFRPRPQLAALRPGRRSEAVF